MAARKYEQRLRAESAEATRRRILDAVAHELRASPTEPVSLDRVAQHARVARSTVYLVFGSRAGLFDAFAEDLWERSGLADLTEAVAHADAREHLRAGIRASCEMYAAERDLYRVLFAMARLDPESVGGAIAKKETNRAGGMDYLARRLADQGYLRADVDFDEAVRVLWVLASFETYDLLATGRKLGVDAAADTIIAMAERALLRERRSPRANRAREHAPPR
jgi:AcrR family transcriptional regulator